jgi:hypothetical protein
VRGFAEVEYGLLRCMGAIVDSTPAVISVNFGSWFCNFVLASPSKDSQR